MPVYLFHGLGSQCEMRGEIADELVEHLRLSAGGSPDAQGVPESENGIEKGHEKQGRCRPLHEPS